MINRQRNNLINTISDFARQRDENCVMVSHQAWNRAYRLLFYMYIGEGVTATASHSGGNITFHMSLDSRKMEIECKVDKYIIREYHQNEQSIVYGVNIENIHEVCNAVKLFFGKKMQRTCLFTGAFNPPTLAHFHMADFAIKAGGFDYVIFATSNQKFLDKKQAKIGDYAYSERERVQFLNAMLKDSPNALVFGIEEGYTYDVLCAVKAKYNPDVLFFALGSDKLKEIGRWGYHDKLLSEFGFYVLQREDGMDYIKQECDRLFHNTEYIIGKSNEKYKDISATQVRNAIKTGRAYKHLVTNSVYHTLQCV